MSRWLVIVARDRPELWVTWTAFYAGAGAVEILLDRRQAQPWPERGDRADRRARPDRDTDLRGRGFLVIRRPELVGASH